MVNFLRDLKTEKKSDRQGETDKKLLDFLCTRP